MPNHKAQAKSVRVSKRRNLRNRAGRSALRTAIRRVDEVIASGSEQGAVAQQASQAASIIGKAANKHIIHKRKADRLRSRLQLRVNRANAEKTTE